MAIMNLMTIAQFFEAIYTSIFKYFFAAISTKGCLLEPISIYFGRIKTNDQEILYLYYLVWLQKAFYLVKLHC